jgi:O-antigen ligase
MLSTRSLTSGGAQRRLQEGRLSGRARLRTVPQPNGLVRAVFALFVLSVPFEAIDFLATGNEFSIARLIGILMIGVALTQMEICFARPPKAFWMFAGYLFVLAAVGMTVAWDYRDAVKVKLVTLAQLLILFWIASNLLRYPKVARYAIAALAAATLGVAVLDIAGIGRTPIPGSGRISMFGDDPNSIAGTLSLGILAWIGLGRELKRQGTKWAMYWWIPCPIIAATVIRTGSRGGVIALLSGILMLLLEKSERRKRARSRFAVVAIAVLFVLGLLTSATSVARWQETLLEGKYSDRDRIPPMAWGMFLDRPLIGWGPVRNIAELGARRGPIWSVEELGNRRGWVSLDTHNGLLAVLTEVGLTGLIPYALGVWLCLRAAWRGRRRAYGVIPLALVTCALVVNMSVTWNNRKFYWLILALGSASAAIVEPRRRARPGHQRIGMPASIERARQAV